MHHATIVDEHEQRVKAEAAKHANSPRKQGGKGHWAQLRVSAPAPSLRDFAFAVRLARRWMPSSHFPSIAHVIDRSANKGSPDGPRAFEHWTISGRHHQ